LYPWECGNCRQHFLLKKRHEAHRGSRHSLQVAD
jgi:hypothetical protein